MINLSVKGSTQAWRMGAISMVVVGAGLLFYSTGAFAADSGGTTIGTLADNITKSFQSIGKLIIATSYLAGLGFAVSALFKFKQHKDNPQQVPIGTPIALLIIGAIMIFLPLILKPAGQTIFGNDAATGAGGFTGDGISVLPGQGTGTGKL